MCGISGIATTSGLTGSDPALVDQMLSSLRHRGPDEQRKFVDGYAAIGARRLSIIDLDTGSQPIANEDGTIHVTQNGEIYNYVELRDLLETRGHRFRSQGDTETIAHLYEEFGDCFVDHLRGMFAIALWDAGRRRLVLARDRLGKKPLYWRLDDGRLSYGSELKALLCDATLSRVVDRAALAQYLQYQYIPSPSTIFQGVEKLAPATVLVWEAGRVSVRRYWEPTYSPSNGRTPHQERERCLELLEEAVRLRLRSDVPVGLFLSGGMDSSTVLALMARAMPGRVKTFSIGFDDVGLDERPFARAVARLFDAEHTEEVVRLDVVSLLPELATHYDEPFGDSSAVPTFRVAQIAAKHVRVVLTGDGGDETFGGYARYRSQMAFHRLQRLPPPARRGLVRGRLLARRLAGRRQVENDSTTRLDELAGLSPNARYVRMMSMSDVRFRSRLMGGDPVANQDAFLISVLEGQRPGLLHPMLAADTLTYLPDDLLTKIDRATMAHSLEARAPLLDHRLVEFVAGLPEARKINGGVTKVLLREIAHTLLPGRMVERPKQGFAVPLAGWFRAGLADIYRDLVLSPDAMIRDHLDQKVAASLLDQHLDGPDQGPRLWLLLSFEFWARRWLRSTAQS